ncbi:MAG: flagellar basal body P-ring formation chaperone FlgA [Schwartzia sp. (in: firmicutes)]
MNGGRILRGLLFAFLFFFPAAVEAYGMSVEEMYPQELSSEVLTQLAVDHIEAVLAEGGESRRHTVTADYAISPLRLPEGAVACTVETPHGIRYWGGTEVLIHVSVDGIPFRKVACRFRLHVFDHVVVAARGISPRQTLTAEDLRVEEQEIGASGGKYYTDVADVVGLVCNRRLNAGQAVLQTMVKKPHIVKPGAMVTIVAQVNGVEVRMEGVALSSGREGEVIRVRNVASRRVVLAKVIDAGTVEVARG